MEVRITEAVSIVSAVAAMISAFTALYVVIQKEKLQCTFLWDERTNQIPTIIICNIGNRMATIDSIVFYCDSKELGKIDLFKDKALSEHSLINIGERKSLSIDPDQIQVPFDITCPDVKKQHKIKAVIKTGTKKSYKMTVINSEKEFSNLITSAYWNYDD